MKDESKWFGKKDFGRILSVDFDGVIAQFDGWKGPNIFGQRIAGSAAVLNALKLDGWTIYIFTSRLVTEELIRYLEENNIPFDDINGRVVKLDSGSTYVNLQTYDIDNDIYGGGSKWSENPSNASIKPIASVYLDDMNYENGGKNYDESKWFEILDNLRCRFGHGAA